MSWRQAGTSGRRSQQKGSRLKEVTLDPLEAIGLPSRGENSLRDLERQRDYYGQILERYEKLQIRQGQDDAPVNDILSLKSLHLEEGASKTEKEAPSSKDLRPILMAVEDKYRNELATIITAMRKLRESIIASRRTDSFAVSSYSFIIRSTILVGAWEAYHPALLHLLRHILPVNLSSKAPLSESRNEFVGYLILDLACRQDDLEEAHAVQYKSKYQNENVNGLLKAITRNDWFSYWRLRERLDGYQKQLCSKADERMRARALDCLDASYRPQVPKNYVEAVAGKKLSEDELRVLKPNWEIKGDDFVVIKRKR